MYVFWEKGISPREFKKTWMKDVKMIMKIKNAIGEKEMREAQIRKMMSKVRY